MKRKSLLPICLLIVAAGITALASCDLGIQTFETKVGTNSASPSGLIRAISSADKIPNAYIVVLKKTGTTANTRAISIDRAASLSRSIGKEPEHVYSNAFSGFSINASESEILTLLKDPNVAYIQESKMMHLSGTQLNPPSWGIDRVDQLNLPLDNYYDYAFDGTGVDAYIVDTGIHFSHSEFEGRAISGTNILEPGTNANDDQGHGTHVAGTVGGKTTGVAKKIRLIAVRVIGKTGETPDSNVIAGIDWAIQNHTTRPAVMNISLGGEVNPAVDEAVRNATADGIVVCVAAGNDGHDAALNSPAGEPLAITVGSVDYSDAIAPTSNFGAVVDVFAPGDGIKSASYLGDASYATWSGTSMACPHVTGVAALILQRNASYTPAFVQEVIKYWSAKNVLLNIPPGTGNRSLFSAQDATIDDSFPTTTTTTILFLQAEDSNYDNCLNEDAYRASGNYLSGFNLNSSTEFTVDSPFAQSVDVTLVYSTPTVASVNIYVNNGTAKLSNLPSSGGWGIWSAKSARVSLRSGTNLIRYQNDFGATGKILLDYIIITPVGVVPRAPSNYSGPVGHFEVENKSYSGCSFSSAVAGYHGSGYLENLNPGGEIAFSVYSPENARAFLNIRGYSFQSVAGQPSELISARLEVNGSFVDQPTFWRKPIAGWTNKYLLVQLNVGINTISIKNYSHELSPIRIDYIEIDNATETGTTATTTTTVAPVTTTTTSTTIAPVTTTTTTVAPVTTTTTIAVVDRTESGIAFDNGATNPASEGEAKAFDNSSSTKWLVYSSTGTIGYDFAGTTAYAINSYSVASANDRADRDPKNWAFEGSNNGTAWTQVDSRSGINFSARFQTQTFSFSNTTSYQQYRLRVTAINGGAYLQLSELKMFGNAGTSTTTTVAPVTTTTTTTVAPVTTTTTTTIASSGTLAAGTYKIVNKLSNNAMKTNSYTSGMFNAPYDSSGLMKWSITKVGSYYKMVSVGNGYALKADYYGGPDHEVIDNGDDELFTVTDVGAGYFKISLKTAATRFWRIDDIYNGNGVKMQDWANDDHYKFAFLAP